MSNTYTFNNLNFSANLLQNADFMQNVEESIGDYLPATVNFTCKYCANTNTLQVTVNKNLSVADLTSLADCYAELSALPGAFA